eukprot:CAMPEP_0117534552 /NCGR_PEP_ID=MMETSP0784-20121206/40470_1 /TAXON_ID=39447 /ORGANISM="" /LENGTH=108 /DNA_ID=CAMNT_0005331035 /DNA_START=275 /DNA_END=597 /DNA_ORIENTATION=+
MTLFQTGERAAQAAEALLYEQFVTVAMHPMPCQPQTNRAIRAWRNKICVVVRHQHSNPKLFRLAHFSRATTISGNKMRCTSTIGGERIFRPSCENAIEEAQPQDSVAA